MGNCCETQVHPEPSAHFKLLEDYNNLVQSFLSKKPYQLTKDFCNLHRKIHEDFYKLKEKLNGINHELYTELFEKIYNYFVDALIDLYEENKLTIDPELRETEQIKKMFNL